MKWMIASDLHGSAYYTEKLLRLYEASGADRLLLLGDILYHGPRNALPEGYDPARVAAMLNAHAQDICCIHGNCDSDVDQMVLDFPITSDYMCFPVGDRLCFATHGHVYSEDRLPKLRPGDLFLFGHIHVPRCEAREGITVLNPGSVSIPKEGSRHSCMLLEDGRLSWLDLDGAVYQTFEVR